MRVSELERTYPGDPAGGSSCVQRLHWIHTVRGKVSPARLSALFVWVTWVTHKQWAGTGQETHRFIHDCCISFRGGPVIVHPGSAVTVILGHFMSTYICPAVTSRHVCCGEHSLLRNVSRNPDCCIGNFFINELLRLGHNDTPNYIYEYHYHYHCTSQISDCEAFQKI